MNILNAYLKKTKYKFLKVGDRVFTTNSVSGTYAEYTVSVPHYTFRLDDSLSFEEGSAIGVPYFTAYKALFLKYF